MKRKITILFSILLVSFLFLPITSLGASPVATLTVDGILVGSYDSVQQAVDAVTQTNGNRFVVEIAQGTFNESLNITQQLKKDLIIRPQQGASVTFVNTVTIDGNNQIDGSESLQLQGLSFDMTSGSPENCIYFNLIPPNTQHCYPHNITINDCHFKGVEGLTVGIQSVGRGSCNISIINCTATNMHSLAQLKAVQGYALIQNCVLDNSVEGVNFYGTGNLVVDSCQFHVSSYAVRSGQSIGKISDNGSVTINNSILKSSSAKDGILILRGDSTRKINILHSMLTSSAANGMALQNLNADNSALYQIVFVETDINDLVFGVDTSTVNIIDDPNVPNGPINLNPQSNYRYIFILVAILSILLIILIPVIITFIILFIILPTPCHRHRCRRHRKRRKC